MKKLVLSLMLASPASADYLNVYTTANALFDRLPALEVAEDFNAACGGGRNTNEHIYYCTTHNTIFVSEAFPLRPQGTYEIAHVLGHAIQVRHGVADVALNAIRNRRDEEDALRGMVTRQVECVAGVLMAQAGEHEAGPGRMFSREPFTAAHWGRSPVNTGPRVSIGMLARQDWYTIGYASRDFASCSVGEMSSDLIVEALRD